VLAGPITADAGQWLMDGEVVQFRSPIEARRAGIETVYQNSLSRRRCRSPTISSSGARSGAPAVLGERLPPARPRRDAREAREHLNSPACSPSRTSAKPVETLSGGQRQGVAVCADRRGSRVVIMDEPTPRSRERIAKSAGAYARREEARLPIILISHNMPHSRGRRPHPHPPARPAHRGHQPEGIFPCPTRSPIMTGAMKPPEKMAA